MPLPPPPPRLPTAPLAPPPLPASGPGSQKNSLPAKAPDRNALLSQIRGGTRLKKAVTNDRSAPIVDKSKPSAGGFGSGGPPGLGGLMSQGIPKLRPPGSRTGDKNAVERPNFYIGGVNKTSNTALQSSLLSLEAQKNKKDTITTNMLERKNRLEHSLPSNDAMRRPAPPPSKLKPSFVPNSNETTTKPTPPPSTLKPGFMPNSTAGPPLQKSSFHDKIQTRNSPAPPAPVPRQLGNKPLPPSKLAPASNANMSFSPSHTSDVTKGSGLLKPPQPITRNHTFSAVTAANCKGTSTLAVNSSALPVRNNSVPDNLNQLTRQNAPRLPPPPVPPPANKPVQSPSVNHSPKFQQNNRPSPAPQHNFTRSSEPPPLPKSAPPPLPHRSPQTLPRVGRSSPAPPPPARTYSKPSNLLDMQEFESRFREMFHDIQEFPFPSYKITPHKFYMSQVLECEQNNEDSI